MKYSYYFLVFLLITGVITESGAQMLRENELVVIKGEKFVLHQVRTGETLFSISRQYQVTSRDLAGINPNIAKGLKIGDMLKIPYREGVEWQQQELPQKGDPDYFESYTIRSRTETPYFIAREFGITVEQIYAYNPEITRFRKGTTLRIPRWGIQPATTTGRIIESQQEDISDRELILYEVQPGETLESIAKQFRISESEILFFNPGAGRLTPGSIIHLPKPSDGTGRENLAEKREEIDSEYADDVTFFDHTIVSGETLWSITRKYNVSEFELKRLNPILESGFPAGITIKVPIRQSELANAEPINEEAFLRHEVKAGETLFGLSSEYNLSIPDLRKFNPQLESRNLVVGETILIPRQIDAPIVRQTDEPDDESTEEASGYEDSYYEVDLPVIIPENCMPDDFGLRMASSYDVVLFLPLFVSQNDEQNMDLVKEELPVDSLFAIDEVVDEDTIIETDEPEELFYNFYRDSENYLKFYEGVLLAVDSLQRAGMHIVLHVFDTQQNPAEIRKHIYSPNFLNTDLIIGPVFPNIQDEVAAIAAKNRIPLVSPLSAQSGVLESNPFYFQVNPTREFIISKTAELVAEEYFNSNFIVIKTDQSGSAPEEKVVNLVREKLAPSGYWNNPKGMLYNEVNFSSDGVAGLRKAFRKDKANVVFVSSMHEGDLSIVLSNVNNIARNFDVTLIGFNRYEQFRSIQEDFFHNLRLQFIAPYWVDYSHPETIRFLQDYKREFHTEPGNFGMQGYDVAFYFLNAIKNYGKEFVDCLPYQQVHLSQGSYSFEKQAPLGGYMNQGVSVISYEPDFDIVRKRIIGAYRYASK